MIELHLRKPPIDTLVLVALLEPETASWSYQVASLGISGDLDTGTGHYHWSINGRWHDEDEVSHWAPLPWPKGIENYIYGGAS